MRLAKAHYLQSRTNNTFKVLAVNGQSEGWVHLPTVFSLALWMFLDF